ncbi:chromate transporter [Clostridium sp. Cult2]|uniref:chromate transporter n=1 Tax=Clostridium sp. Cult2 TaxID=2079003 RepID=UPI001F40D355|nr:chromate transporter [Clostridium sp. Cult2]MCF6465030.1 chromate transporter [Clostridium sp. Cult2]
MSLLIKLFISFFKIGAFSFGGGYAMLPLIKEEVIEVHGWLTNAEFIDILAISEMTPGPIAINTATFLGYRVSGILGSFVATIAVVLPSFIIMSIIFHFLNKFKDSPYTDWFFIGIRPIVLGLIASASISVAMDAFIDLKSVIISVILFYLVSFKKLNPIYAIILAGITGAIIY